MKTNKNLITICQNMVLIVAITFLAMLHSCETPYESPCDGTKVTFEDLSIGTSYNLGDVFTSDGVSFTVVQFIWGNGNPSPSGTVTVSDQQLSGGSGNDIFISNVSVKPTLPAGTTKITFNAGTYGGNMNLKVNGDFLNFNDIATISSTTLGGVLITATGSQGAPGTWTLEGNITSFEVGGQEFWVDNLCIESDEDPEPTCDIIVKFEDLTVGTSYNIGDVFTSDGLSFTVVQFIWGNVNPSPSGTVTVSDQQLSGGSGNDIFISNVSVKPTLPVGTTKITFNAGTYGGNMNLKVNGDFLNFNDIAAISSSTLGGVSITATGFQGTPGIWTLEGDITSIEVGGQEFWVDNLCITVKE